MPSHHTRTAYRFPAPSPVSPPILSFNDVSFGYPGGPTLFHNLNFGIDTESRFAMVGPNGAPSSAIAECLLRAHRTAGDALSRKLMPLQQCPRGANPRRASAQKLQSNCLAPAQQQPQQRYPSCSCIVHHMVTLPHLDCRHRQIDTAQPDWRQSGAHEGHHHTESEGTACYIT